MLKGGQNPEKGDDQDAEGLTHTEDKRLQGEHGLPRRLVHARYGRTGEDTTTHWSHDAHEEDGDGHEPGRLMLA